MVNEPGVTKPEHAARSLLGYDGIVQGGFDLQAGLILPPGVGGSHVSYRPSDKNRAWLLGPGAFEQHSAAAEKVWLRCPSLVKRFDCVDQSLHNAPDQRNADKAPSEN